MCLLVCLFFLVFPGNLIDSNAFNQLNLTGLQNTLRKKKEMERNSKNKKQTKTLQVIGGDYYIKFLL